MADSPRLSRRAALQGLASTLGAAAAAAPAGAEPHPIGAHIAQRASRTAPRSPSSSAKRFLGAHELETLSIVADLIVPGAVASGSPRFIDEVLAIERPAVQQRFLSALGALDAAARAEHQQPFKGLARARQIAVLEAAAAKPTGEESPAPPESTADPERAKPTGPTVSLRDPVSHLKTWIAGAHFSSEAGMKELGWTGTLFFKEFPACTHTDGHE